MRCAAGCAVAVGMLGNSARSKGGGTRTGARGVGKSAFGTTGAGSGAGCG
jgi:hypothetical protein